MTTALRIISKVKKGKWRCHHHDGSVSYHRTLRAAKAYRLPLERILNWHTIEALENGSDHQSSD